VPLQRTFSVPDVSKANVSVDLTSPDGTPIYKLQCHSAGYDGDPGFDYSGDFECRLSSIAETETYSTLLTDDFKQSRDWQSRGRFFAQNLRGACARIPEFGPRRDFTLRGMQLKLEILDPKFKADGTLTNLRLAISVRPDLSATTPIAAIVPIPAAGVPAECRPYIWSAKQDVRLSGRYENHVYW
jgi:hypothetical protein